MIDPVRFLNDSVHNIRTEDDFERWVRQDFRRVLPHAILIATLGRILGMGSVSTHRFGVDCPLNLIEGLKNVTGALDDPLMFRWFRSGRASFINVSDVNGRGGQQGWRRTMERYGVRGMSIHGFQDHAARRFVAFQLANPNGGGSIENLKLLSELSKGMADAAWRSIEARATEHGRESVCHPTLGLTPAEVHIVELISQGLSNKEIARRRGVSDSTIKTQVQRTGAKLGATRRAEIVAIAMPMLAGLPSQSLIDYDDF